MVFVPEAREPDAAGFQRDPDIPGSRHQEQGENDIADAPVEQAPELPLPGEIDQADTSRSEEANRSLGENRQTAGDPDTKEPAAALAFLVTPDAHQRQA